MMVNTCCAYGCKNRFIKNSGIGFFRFPRDPERRKMWTQALKRKQFEPSEETRICGKHFQTGKPSKDQNHPDFIPNVFTFTNTSNTAVKYEARQKRIESRSNGITDVNLQMFPSDSISESEDEVEKEEELQKLKEELQQAYKQINILKEVKDDLHKKLQMAYTEINALREEKDELKEKNQDEDQAQNIIGNTKKLLFYTGLNSVEVFNWLISLLMNCENGVKTVSLETQLLIVLMKLKLNLLFTDLAYRFQISRHIIYRIFDNIIPALAINLKVLIIWPNDKALKKNLPLCFKNSFYKNTKCIIDCTEVRIQRPSNMLARAQTWSSYKQCHTIKFLVGTSPSGIICFLSECWGGRVSDKQITLQSGFLDNIKAGDSILRGFRSFTQQYQLDF